MTDEIERIRTEYARRAQTLPGGFYSVTHPANLFLYQQKSRLLLQMLNREGLIPLKGKAILDVGCGEGQQLLDLESWGARRSDLAGIDLIEARLARARARLCVADVNGELGPDLRVGDASLLPWPDETFDIVYQSTVFTSILDSRMKVAVAREMLRVLKPAGVLIWYDFKFNNFRNPHVRGIKARELRSLFQNCVVTLKSVTLAPPIARRLVPITWIGSLILERMQLLNTHYLALIRRGAKVTNR